MVEDSFLTDAGFNNSEAMKGLLSAILLLVSVCYSYGRVICSRNPVTGSIRYCDAGWHCCGGNYCCRNSVPKSNDGLSGGAIAGIVIGSLAGLLVLCCLISCCVDGCNKGKTTVRNLNTNNVSTVSGNSVQNPQGQRFGVNNGLPTHLGPGRPHQPIAFTGDQTGGPWNAQLPGSTNDGMPPQYSQK